MPKFILMFLNLDKVISVQAFLMKIWNTISQALPEFNILEKLINNGSDWFKIVHNHNAAIKLV